MKEITDDCLYFSYSQQISCSEPNHQLIILITNSVNSQPEVPDLHMLMTHIFQWFQGVIVVNTLHLSSFLYTGMQQQNKADHRARYIHVVVNQVWLCS